VPTIASKLTTLLQSNRLRAGELGAPRQDPVAGVIWVTLSMALLAGLAAFSRAAMNTGLSPPQVVFFRNLSACLVFLPLLAFRGRTLLVSEQLKTYGWRCVVSVISMQAWFCALYLIPLGELTAISFLAPLFGTLAAILFLGETVRARRWSALAVGFLGAMIILRPGLNPLGVGQVCALIAALTSGVVAILVKQLTHRDDPDKIVFLTNAILTPLSLLPALFFWRAPSAEAVPFLIGMGLCAVLGHVTLVRGFAATDASLVLTFEFSKLPFSVAIAYLAFGETIDTGTWIGALVIFASAVYIARREAQLRQHGGRRSAS
jgi:drug/metabolite transporter (DMT)-like permease